MTAEDLNRWWLVLVDLRRRGCESKDLDRTIREIHEAYMAALERDRR